MSESAGDELVTCGLLLAGLSKKPAGGGSLEEACKPLEESREPLSWPQLSVLWLVDRDHGIWHGGDVVGLHRVSCA